MAHAVHGCTKVYVKIRYRSESEFPFFHGYFKRVETFPSLDYCRKRCILTIHVVQVIYAQPNQTYDFKTHSISISSPNTQKPTSHSPYTPVSPGPGLLPKLWNTSLNHEKLTLKRSMYLFPNGTLSTCCCNTNSILFGRTSAISLSSPPTD